MVVPGAPVPRSALTGALIDRAPEVTVKVTVVSGSPPPGLFEYASTAGLSGTAEATPGDSTTPKAAIPAMTQTADLTIFPYGTQHSGTLHNLEYSDDY
jgi:hypothetical protein